MKTIGYNNSTDVDSSRSCVMFCSTKEFLKEQKKSSFCLAMMLKQVQEIGKKSHVPSKIQPLLNEFKEIVADVLPVGIPPLRNISHQIELIPRSSLPNKSPY